jgi:hypothetical protein
MALISGSTLISDRRTADGARCALLEPIVETPRVEDVAADIDISQDLMIFDLQLTDAAAIGGGVVCGRQLESSVPIHVA